MGNDRLIQQDELNGLFDNVVGRPPARCALAVSGGSDSTALMVLFADWLRACEEDASAHAVVTVDHGLRPDSGDEARIVSERASALGLRHAILPWEGRKPDTGIQAIARQVRYGLIANYMRANRLSLLLTGHTQDDQAETVLMRLARGSGLDGLSGIMPGARLGELGLGDCDVEGMTVARPLLAVPRSRLRATLSARGIPWIDDPSNTSPDFERPRWRAARAELDALGLAPDRLALTAARLLRARRSIERAVDHFCDPAAPAVAVDPLGIVTVDRRSLQAADEEVALRVLGRAAAACGGSPEPIPLAKLESLAAVLRSSQHGRWTLARAMVTATEDTVRVEREPGRQPLPTLQLRPGEQKCWDGRFGVQIAADASVQVVEVRACGVDRASQLLAQRPAPAGTASRAAATVPSFWSSGELLAVPSLDFWSAPHCRDWLSAWFLGGDSVRGQPAAAARR